MLLGINIYEPKQTRMDKQYVKLAMAHEKDTKSILLIISPKKYFLFCSKRIL